MTIIFSSCANNPHVKKTQDCLSTHGKDSLQWQAWVVIRAVSSIGSRKKMANWISGSLTYMAVLSKKQSCLISHLGDCRSIINSRFLLTMRNFHHCLVCGKPRKRIKKIVLKPDISIQGEKNLQPFLSLPPPCNWQLLLSSVLSHVFCLGAWELWKPLQLPLKMVQVNAYAGYPWA